MLPDTSDMFSNERLLADPINLGAYLRYVDRVRYVHLAILTDKLGGNYGGKRKQVFSRIVKYIVDDNENFNEEDYFSFEPPFGRDSTLLRFDCFVMLMVMTPQSKLPRSEKR